MVREILWVLETGMQWKSSALRTLCPGSTAHDWFKHWSEAGLFARLQEEALVRHDRLAGVD